MRRKIKEKNIFLGNCSGPVKASTTGNRTHEAAIPSS